MLGTMFTNMMKGGEISTVSEFFEAGNKVSLTVGTTIAKHMRTLENLAKLNGNPTVEDPPSPLERLQWWC